MRRKRKKVTTRKRRKKATSKLNYDAKSSNSLKSKHLDFESE